MAAKTRHSGYNEVPSIEMQWRLCRALLEQRCELGPKRMISLNQSMKR